MSLYDTHAAALKATQTLLGTACPTISWNSLEWLVVTNTAQRRSDLQPGGFQLNADLTFEILLDQFGQPAEETASEFANTIVGYLGEQYKVDSFNIRPGGLQARVECNSASQNS